MATKAELQAELEKLKAEMARDRASGTAASPTTATPDSTTVDPDTEPSGLLDGWSDMLKSHGLDASDTEALLAQLSNELGDLPRNKPLITAIAAFGVGFVLGRMSK